MAYRNGKYVEFHLTTEKAENLCSGYIVGHCLTEPFTTYKVQLSEMMRDFFGVEFVEVTENDVLNKPLY